MRGNRRLIALRVFLSTLGGAAFGVLGWAALATLTGALLAGVTFLAVTGLGALAGLGASAGFLLARPTHASRREWVWWALGLLPLGLFYGALLGVGEGSGRGLANRLGVVAVVVVLALAVVSAAILIGRSVALRRGGGAVSRGAVAVMAGVVCGGAAGLGFGLAELVTLQSVVSLTSIALSRTRLSYSRAACSSARPSDSWWAPPRRSQSRPAPSGVPMLISRSLTRMVWQARRGHTTRL